VHNHARRWYKAGGGGKQPRARAHLPRILLAEARFEVEDDGCKANDEAGGQDALDHVRNSGLHGIAGTSTRSCD